MNASALPETGKRWRRCRDWFWEFSLQRLLGIILLAGGMTLGAALLSYFVFDYRLERQAVGEQAQRLGESLVRAQSSRLEASFSLARTLADVPSLRVLDDSDCPQAFTRAMQATRHVANVGLLAADGSPVCSVRPIPEGRSMAGFRFVEEAVSPGQLTVGDLLPLLADEDDGRVIHIGLRLEDESAEGRILFLAIDPFQEILPGGMADLTERYRLGLLAPDGNWLYHHAPDEAVFSDQVRESVQRAAQSDSGMAHWFGEDPAGKAYSYSLRSIAISPDRRLHFVAAMPLDVGLMGARQQLVLSLVVLFMGLGVSWLVGQFMLNRFAKRNIEPILAGLDRMAEGFPTAMDPRGMSREMARIATVLNSADRQRRQQEARLRLHTEASPLAVIEWDTDFRVTNWSKSAEELFGWSKEDVVGRKPNKWRFVYEDDLERVAEHLRELQQGQADRRQFENRNWTRDGRLLHCIWFTALVRNRSGKIKSFLTFSMDISGKVKAEEELRKLNQELENRVAQRTYELEMINRELETFSYSVSHDLRAPLRGIDGFAQALEEDYEPALDEQGRHYLQRIKAGARRMGMLIDDLLALAQVSRGPIKRRRISISEMARKICEELSENATDHPIRWQIEEGLETVADPDLTRVLLQNLLENAWKFTRGTDTAEVQLQALQDQPETFMLQDNGAGFDPEQAEHIFAPFQRLHRQEEFEGTGIGLATVYRIVQRHAGFIEARGYPGEGATFVFSLRQQLSGMMVLDPKKVDPEEVDQ